MDWNDWMRNDKTLLTVLMLAFLGVWCANGAEKLMDLITTLEGALIALITGEVLRRRNGGQGEEKR